MQETLVSVAAGVLAALKADGLVPKEPALAMPLVTTALLGATTLLGAIAPATCGVAIDVPLKDDE